MLNRFTSTILVSAGELGAEAPESRRVRYAVMDGRKVVQHSDCGLLQIQSLGGRDVRVGFFSRSAYFGRSQAQTENKRLATVVARRFIDGEMLFTDPYRLRLTTRLVSENEVRLKLMAAGEIDCIRLEDALPLDTQPISLATLEEAAIAALVAKATVEPVLVLFARAERFLSLVVEDGEVRQRRLENIEPGDMVAAEAAAQRAEMLVGSAMAGEFVAGGDAAKEAALKIYLGDLRPLAALPTGARDYVARELEKKIAAQIKGADALLEPELFGLAFVSRKWNFLEEEQAHKARAWQVAFPVSMLTIAGALVFGFMAFADLAGTARLGDQLQNDQKRLVADRDALMQHVPQGKELERFNELTSLLKRRSEQVRVDRLLAWMTRELPAGITISSVQMYLQGDSEAAAQAQTAGGAGGGGGMFATFFGSGSSGKEEEETKKAQQKQPVRQPGTYVVRMELNLPGSYTAVEELAAETIRHLSPKLHFVRSQLAFDAANNKGQLVSELTANAEDFH